MRRPGKGREDDRARYCETLKSDATDRDRAESVLKDGEDARVVDEASRASVSPDQFDKAAKPQRSAGSGARARRIASRALELGVLALALAVTRYLTIYAWKLPNGDVYLYHNYALAFWTQRPLLHALPVEYPALAIVPFTLTLLPPIGDYFALYAYWMGALVIVSYVLIARYTTRRRAVVYAVYLLLGATATLLARFDLIPALLTLAALAATGRRRFDLAYLLFAAGVLLKLYPLFLLPVVALAHYQALAGRPLLDAPVRFSPRVWWRRGPRALAASIHSVNRDAWRESWRALRAHPAVARVAKGVALCLGAVALGFWCALALSPNGAFSGFSYASDRPLQVESTPATLLWLGTLIGIPAGPVYSFASLNYVGPLDAVLKPLSAVALLAACGVVYWRQARGQLSVGRAFLACLCAVIATNKLFSPQYLLWVLPLVAVVDGFDLAWLAICLLTTLDFPILYTVRHQITTVTYTPAFMPVLALRNLLFIGVTLRTMFARSPGGQRVAQGQPPQVPSRAVAAPLRAHPANPSPAARLLAGMASRLLLHLLTLGYRFGLRNAFRHVTHCAGSRARATGESPGIPIARGILGRRAD